MRVWSTVRPSLQSDARRRAQLVIALAIASVLLDWLLPLPAAPTTKAFWGIFVAIASAIGHFLHSAGDVVLAALVSTVNYLRAGVAVLGKTIKSGIFEAGRATARALRAVKTFITDALPRFVRWTFAKLTQFETWLHRTFAPVFKFLSAVRERLNWFYKTFLRPIIDTLEFLRAINRVLLAFHITWLQKLDRVLAEIEQKIEEPFLWVNAKLNEIWNVLDRVVTLDGFFQRITLVRSLSRYAPAWLRIAVNARMKPLSQGDLDALYRPFGGRAHEDVAAAVAGSLTGEGGIFDAFVDEFTKEITELIEAA